MTGADSVTGRVFRVSQVATVINGFPFDARDFSADAEVPLVRIRDLTSSSFETFIDRDLVPGSAFIRNDDIIIGMDGEFNSTLWERGEAALNQRVCALRTHPDADPRYLAYAIPEHLQVINDLTWSTTVKHLAASKVRAIRIPARPLEEQREIADYLDRETAQIDAFIAKNEELIALLTERKAGVIAKATSGPKRSHEDAVPGKTAANGSEWREMRLSWIFKSTASGTTPPTELVVDADEADHFWVTTGELREKEIWSTLRGVSDETLKSLSALKLHPADSLLIAMYGATIGRTGILRVPAASNQAVCALTSPIMCTPEYVEYSLLANRERLLLQAEGGGQPNVNQETIRSFRIPVPPLEIQKQLVEKLQHDVANLDNSVQTAQRAIELAKERRAALISAAVTGKIDVSKEASAI